MSDSAHQLSHRDWHCCEFVIVRLPRKRLVNRMIVLTPNRCSSKNHPRLGAWPHMGARNEPTRSAHLVIELHRRDDGHGPSLGGRASRGDRSRSTQGQRSAVD